MLSFDSLIQSDRFFPEHSPDMEFATEQDRIRIVQSAPVRRLQQKTQVFPLDVKASVRSRLTHSLEVQQAGRQLIFAIRKKQSPDWPLSVVTNLVEMSCLLHDVGNPPFGHFGESVLREWLSQQLDTFYDEALNEQVPSEQWQKVLHPDLCSFDGNAQSLRLVHSLQQLNLTYSQLACIIKYPRLIDESVFAKESKIGIFISERELIGRLREQLQLPMGIRHPLVFIMEAADDISYTIADVDDAVDRKLLTLEQALSDLQTALNSEANEFLQPMIDDAKVHPQGFFPRFRFLLSNVWVELAATAYVQHKTNMLNGRFVGHLLEQEHPAIDVLNGLKKLARQSIFGRKEVESLELSGYAAMRGVLAAYGELLILPAGKFRELLEGTPNYRLQREMRLCHRLSPRHVKAYLAATAVHQTYFDRFQEQEWYYRVRLLLDFISGMTDTYILEEYKLLYGLA